MNLGRKSLYEAVMEAEMTDDSDNEESMQYPMARSAVMEVVKQKKDRIPDTKPEEKMEQRMSQNLDSLVNQRPQRTSFKQQIYKHNSRRVTFDLPSTTKKIEEWQRQLEQMEKEMQEQEDDEDVAQLNVNHTAKYSG